MKQHIYKTHDGQELLFVQLYPNSQPINVGYNVDGTFLWYKHGHRNYQSKLNVPPPWRTKSIDWQLLGKASESPYLNEAIQALGFNPETTVVLKKQNDVHTQNANTHCL